LANKAVSPDENSPKNEAQKTTSSVAPTGDLIPVSIEIKDNFFTSFTDSSDIQKIAEEKNLPRLGQLLSAHISRNLVWDIDLRKDMRKGDAVSFIFRIIPEEEKTKRADFPDDIEMLAVSYHSQKLNKDFEMHFFKPQGSKFGKFYYSDGKMIEKLLKNGPIKTNDYLQVTSLLHDRRPKHEGIDFKAPVGSPVYAPFNGKILKTNWKVKFNGDSIEMQADGKPVVVKFLHLDKVLIKPGDSVKAGQKIAESGNTGRSTAPHLHYQINAGGEKGKVLDPFEFHEIYYESLNNADLDGFKKKADENNLLMHGKKG